MKSKKYTDEFKIQAVKLAEELGSITGASRQLGMGDVNIHNWRKKFSKNVAVSAARKPELKPDEQTKEILRLQQEVIRRKKVTHILKSAAVFFSEGTISNKIRDGQTFGMRENRSNGQLRSIRGEQIGVLRMAHKTSGCS